MVCSNRNFAIATDVRTPDPEGEQSWPVQYTTGGGFTGGFGVGGGTIQLYSDSSNPLDGNTNHPINKVKEDQWVMLVGLDATNNPIVGKWYRVVGVGRSLDPATPSQPVNMLSLVGPDWPQIRDPSDSTKLLVATVNVVVVDGVTGVYTRTMQLDNDETWSQ